MADETLQRPACAFCNDAGVMASRDLANPSGGTPIYQMWRRLCVCVEVEDRLADPVLMHYVAAPAGT